MGVTLPCSAQASHCSGFFCCGAWAFRGVGFSSCRTQAHKLRLLGSVAQAQPLWLTGLVALRMWDLPGSGMEPVSPALAGRLLTTALPGKFAQWGEISSRASYYHIILLLSWTFPNGLSPPASVLGALPHKEFLMKILTSRPHVGILPTPSPKDSAGTAFSPAPLCILQHKMVADCLVLRWWNVPQGSSLLVASGMTLLQSCFLSPTVSVFVGFFPFSFSPDT